MNTTTSRKTKLATLKNKKKTIETHVHGFGVSNWSYPKSSPPKGATHLSPFWFVSPTFCNIQEINSGI